MSKSLAWFWTWNERKVWKLKQAEWWECINHGQMNAMWRQRRRLTDKRHTLRCKRRTQATIRSASFIFTYQRAWFTCTRAERRSRKRRRRKEAWKQSCLLWASQVEREKADEACAQWLEPVSTQTRSLVFLLCVSSLCVCVQSRCSLWVGADFAYCIMRANSAHRVRPSPAATFGAILLLLLLLAD